MDGRRSTIGDILSVRRVDVGLALSLGAYSGGLLYDCAGAVGPTPHTRTGEDHRRIRFKLRADQLLFSDELISEDTRRQPGADAWLKRIRSPSRDDGLFFGYLQGTIPEPPERQAGRGAISSADSHGWHID